jgi:hypothetical protein
MSETLPRTASAPDQADSLPTADELQTRVYGPENKPQAAPERDDTRELSRPANILYRIGDFLQERKINKLHSKALKEYRSDHYLDYVGHINKLAESDNEDYQDYAKPIAEREAPRAQRERNKLHTEALKEYRSEHRTDFVEHVGKLAKSDNEQVSDYGQKQFNRENRRIGREKFFKEAKSFARDTGTIALEASKTAGFMTVGATMYGIDAIKETGGSLIEEAKRELEKRALVARIRRDDRRKAWNNNKDKFTNRGQATIDKLKSPKTKAAIGASVIRAATLNK